MDRVNTDERTTEKDQGRRLFVVAACLLVLLCSALIVAAAQGDLWLDEVWSLVWAQGATSVADVFARYRHDNNHPLNTLFLYCLGEQGYLFVYRLLSVLSGIGTVLLAGYVARKDWGRLESLASMLVIGTSYPLLIYFSEARGYAPAMLCGTAAYAVFRSAPAKFIAWRIMLFWSLSILGTLSHATFATLTLSFACWGLAEEIQSGASFRSAAWRLLVWHGVPLAFLGFWCFFFLQGMTMGAGPQQDVWLVIGQGTALLMGLPDTPAWHLAAIACVLAVVGWGATKLYQQGDTRWVFFVAATVALPALVVLLSPPGFLHFRYFVVSFPFFLLLLCYLAGQCYRTLPRPWCLLGFAALGILLVGNGPRDVLLTLGRGQYATAIRHIAENSPPGVVRIGSDHDFRNWMLISFYLPRATKRSDLKYVEQREWPAQPPDWFLTHSQDLLALPEEDLQLTGIGQYKLDSQYRYSGVSGWSWFLYRRVETPP